MSEPVVIVGAGPTGITAATLLAQRGIDCTVLDRWSDVYPQPRAVHLDDEVYRIIARLGVTERFREISRPTIGLRLLDGSHRVLEEFRRDRGSGVNGYPQATMFDQPDLERLLRENLRHYRSARLLGDVEVTDIEPADGEVRVHYTDRTDGSRHMVPASYVLGCDGANSLVRNRIGATMRNLKFDQRWLVVDIASTAELGQWDGVHQVCDPHRAATYMRIGPTRYRWEFQLLADEVGADFPDLASLRPLIAPWVGEIDTSAMTLVRTAEYTFRAQIADRWRCGRVFLLGDAAHLTPPFIGQGMGAGIRDAMNLSWKLAAVLSGQLSEAVLDSYEVERKPHARYMIRLAQRIGRVMTGGGWCGDLIRRRALPLLRRFPAVATMVLDSSTPPLRRSALIGRGRLAGVLCPNPVVAENKRFDDMVGDGFVLVARSTADVTAGGVRMHRAAPGDELDRWLRRGRAQVALVRPDGTVMASGATPAPLPAGPGSPARRPTRCR